MAKYDKEARAFNLKKFNAKHRMFKVYLDKKEDAAIIEHLDSHKNKSKAIRQLLNGAKIPVANITFDDDKLKELTDDIVRQIQNGELVMVTESETQGEWIYGEDDCGQDGWFCSECGFFVPWYYQYYEKDINFIRDYKACPHCLAKMVTYTGKDRDTKGGAE